MFHTFDWRILKKVLIDFNMYVILYSVPVVVELSDSLLKYGNPNLVWGRQEGWKENEKKMWETTGNRAQDSNWRLFAP